jgi:hypothetical protein
MNTAIDPREGSEGHDLRGPVAPVEFGARRSDAIL